MKTIHCIKLVGLITAASVIVPKAMADKPLVRHGTSVMHYQTQSTLTSTEAGSNVVGRLRIQMNEQGRSSKQSLDLDVDGLASSTTYRLIAVVGDDTNTIPVVEVVSDRKGRLRLQYKTKGQGNGGGNRNQLPESLTPLVDVRSLGIENSSTQTLAYAWVADAGKFQYLVKCNLSPEDSNGTAAGQMSLIANQRKVQFWLLAGGLSASTNYHLSVNSEVVSTVMANDAGRLEIKGWPTNAPAVLDVHLLSLLDGNSNVVLSATLPR